MKKLLKKSAIVAAGLTLLSPSPLFACAACGSANGSVGNSPLTDGMNVGILTLLGVLLTVLGGAAGLIVYLVRKEAAAEAAASPAPADSAPEHGLPSQNPSVA
ncbi:MAG TPA: hypothetical protein VFV81_07655 [Verrucomicrobiae bacterium]|nr:hypothetical protein [Verrucomicrobiae bacterium]